MDTVSRKFLVRGRVQGVGFRYFTYRVAVRMGVTGWVRNLDDGGVEIVAQGSDRVLEAFETQIRSGPPFSYVESLSSQPEEAGRLEDFRIEG